MGIPAATPPPLFDAAAVGPSVPPPVAAAPAAAAASTVMSPVRRPARSAAPRCRPANSSVPSTTSAVAPPPPSTPNRRGGRMAAATRPRHGPGLFTPPAAVAATAPAGGHPLVKSSTGGSTITLCSSDEEGGGPDGPASALSSVSSSSSSAKTPRGGSSSPPPPPPSPTTPVSVGDAAKAYELQLPASPQPLQTPQMQQPQSSPPPPPPPPPEQQEQPTTPSPPPPSLSVGLSTSPSSPPTAEARPKSPCPARPMSPCPLPRPKVFIARTRSGRALPSASVGRRADGMAIGGAATMAAGGASVHGGADRRRKPVDPSAPRDVVPPPASTGRAGAAKKPRVASDMGATGRPPSGFQAPLANDAAGVQQVPRRRNVMVLDDACGRSPPAAELSYLRAGRVSMLERCPSRRVGVPPLPPSPEAWALNTQRPLCQSRSEPGDGRPPLDRPAAAAAVPKRYSGTTDRGGSGGGGSSPPTTVWGSWCTGSEAAEEVPLSGAGWDASDCLVPRASSMDMPGNVYSLRGVGGARTWGGRGCGGGGRSGEAHGRLASASALAAAVRAAGMHGHSGRRRWYHRGADAEGWDTNEWAKASAACCVSRRERLLRRVVAAMRALSGGH